MTTLPDNVTGTLYSKQFNPTERVPPEVLSLIFDAALLDDDPLTGEYHEPVFVHTMHFDTYYESTLSLSNK